MADKTPDREKIEKKLWKHIEQHRFGMLGVAGGPPRHMAPMTAFHDKDTHTLWFYGDRNTDLVKDIGEDGHAGMFCFMDKDHGVYACLGGDLSLSHDEGRIDKHWSPMVSAWYPEGKDDPKLVLVRFDVVDAQVWVSDSGPVKFAYEIAKANLTKTQPDEGEKAHLRFQ